MSRFTLKQAGLTLACETVEDLTEAVKVLHRHTAESYSYPEHGFDNQFLIHSTETGRFSSQTPAVSVPPKRDKPKAYLFKIGDCVSWCDKTMRLYGTKRLYGTIVSDLTSVNKYGVVKAVDDADEDTDEDAYEDEEVLLLAPRDLQLEIAADAKISFGLRVANVMAEFNSRKIIMRFLTCLQTDARNFSYREINKGLNSEYGAKNSIECVTRACLENAFDVNELLSISPEWLHGRIVTTHVGLTPIFRDYLKHNQPFKPEAHNPLVSGPKLQSSAAENTAEPVSILPAEPVASLPTLAFNDRVAKIMPDLRSPLVKALLDHLKKCKRASVSYSKIDITLRYKRDGKFYDFPRNGTALTTGIIYRVCRKTGFDADELITVSRSKDTNERFVSLTPRFREYLLSYVDPE